MISAFVNTAVLCDPPILFALISLSHFVYANLNMDFLWIDCFFYNWFCCRHCYPLYYTVTSVMIPIYIGNKNKVITPFYIKNSITSHYFLWDIITHPWPRHPWWRHQMETFSALLALCAGNSPVPVNSPHKGQWRGALMFSLINAWINDWVNSRAAGDLRRISGHYDVIVMLFVSQKPSYEHVMDNWAGFIAIKTGK